MISGLKKILSVKLRFQKDIDAFIVERKIPQVHVNDQLKERVKKYLIEEKKKDAINKWLDAKISKTPVSIFL